MLYGVWVEVNASFCLSVLVTCCGVCVFDWGAGVQAEEVILWMLWWSCCSCLLLSDSSFLLFLFIDFLLFLTAVSICTTSSSTYSNVFLNCWGFSILMPCGVIAGTGKCPLPLRFLSSFSITNIVTAASTCCSTSWMYGS